MTIFSIAAFDLHGHPFIHFAPLLLLLWALAPACSENKQAPAPEKKPEVKDASIAAADMELQDEQIPEDNDGVSLPLLDDDSKSGIFRTDEAESKTIALEVGSAPKGHDISLSRQLAASRARAKLLALLKSKELLSRDTQSLPGATIGRFWMEKGKIFALARIELQNIPIDLNVRGPIPSNASEDTRKDTATPQGGAEK